MSPVPAGLLLLLVKHFIGDFVMQTPRHVEGKRRYGAPAGVEHAAIHSALTVPCLLAVGVAVVPALLAATAELAVHYHLDWGKERIVRSRGLTPAEHGYWILLGGDQLAHQLTYLGIVWALL